jgi:hypothetical protein
MGGKSKQRGGIPANRIPEMAETGDERVAPSLEEYQQSSGFLTAPNQSTRLFRIARHLQPLWFVYIAENVLTRYVSGRSGSRGFFTISIRLVEPIGNPPDN